MEARTLLSAFTVTTTDDNADDSNPIPGSLRWAIVQNNADVGNPLANTIAFNIPTPGDDVQIIQPTNDLPAITHPVVIDGYSQPGSRPNTNPINEGDNAHLLVQLDGRLGSFEPCGGCNIGLNFASGSGGSTVRGLVVTGFAAIGIAAGTDTAIEGNFIGIDPTGTQAQGNGSGVIIYGNGGHVGTNGDGLNDDAERNLISGNLGLGVRADGKGNLVAGNLIGTDATGTQPLGNATYGVQLNTDLGVRLGADGHDADPTGERNVISGNGYGGVYIPGSTAVVAGNFIGTDVSGTTPLGNGSVGILVSHAVDGTITIGGPGNLSNVIAFNRGNGVIVVLGTGVAIRGNSIYGNQGLGIDLGGDGVTLNDSQPHTSGPNLWQNFPVLATAYAGPSSSLRGVIQSTPNTSFTLDFYAVASSAPEGYGQGQRWLGSASVTTDGSGHASFGIGGLAASVPDEWISATATGPSGTSEFSQDVQAVPLPPSSLSGVVFSDFNDDGQVDFGEQGIAGVPITLTGTDFLGNPVSLGQNTDADGTYVFQGLLPGSYTIAEAQQPAGYTPGIATVGTGGGTVSGAQFTVALTAGEDAMNYNYGELPAATGSIKKGQTAGIGFWNNKNGQALIKALNGGTGHQLGDWLAATFPHLFGSLAGADNLAGKGNAPIAALFQADFVVHGQKLDAQVLATALAVYATDGTLDNTGVGTQYGFLVGGNGVATSTVNVGSNGAAFGVANNSVMTVLDILLAADAQAVNGVLYNGDATRRNQANAVFGAINEAGGL